MISQNKMMSSYFETLNAMGKERYSEKLTCVGLSIRDDPYLPENNGKFVADMTTWPQLEYGHIFVYFIKRPGVYILKNSYCLGSN